MQQINIKIEKNIEKVLFLTKLQVVFRVASILHIFIVSSIVAVCNNTKLLSNLYDIETRMLQDCFNWLFFPNVFVVSNSPASMSHHFLVLFALLFSFSHKQKTLQ